MAANKTVAPRTWDVYTYAYPDPDNTVFHVGKGVDKRIFAHEQEAENAAFGRLGLRVNP